MQTVNPWHDQYHLQQRLHVLSCPRLLKRMAQRMSSYLWDDLER